MNALAAQIKPLYPTWKKEWGVTVVPMHEQITGDIKSTLFILVGAVGFVLLIACANVANLLLAKASGRQKEMAVRAALGATRGRVIRQLLMEGLLLSAIGALLGLGLAFWSVGTLGQLTAVNLPRAQEVSIDLRVLGFALLVSLLAALAFGLVPALQASRPNLNDMLKEGTRTSDAGSRNRVRSGLIVAEVGVSMVLLVGAGLLLNSFVRLSNVPPGITPENALAMQISLPEKKFPDAERRAVFFAQIIERIEALPGVKFAGLSTTLPMVGPPYDGTFKVDGRVGAPETGYHAFFDFCTPNYFQAMGIPFLRGRFFDGRDTAKAHRAVIISESLWREYFPHDEPLGRQIRIWEEQWEIVGIVGDVRSRGPAEGIKPHFYMPQAFSPWGNGHLVVRTAVAPMSLAEGVRKAILEVDASQPVANVRTMEEGIAASVAQRRFILMLLSGFAGAALLLAAIGLYGVVAYAVSQRTREIGIRMALGATRDKVLGLVLRQGMLLTGMGIVLGVGGALGLTHVLRNMLYEVKANDPLTFTCVSLMLVLVALFASWLPARRAAKLDPMEALRYE